MDRAAILTKLEDAFAARVRGDAEAAAAYFAPGATFRLAGEQSLARAYLGDGGELPLDSAVARIIELVEIVNADRRFPRSADVKFPSPGFR